jgi:ectoine hydroxylase-related dioxygenase (phytanoyl-CoA dioxygenase family)
MTEYEYEKYIATKDNMLEMINKYGVAIIPNVLNNEECDEMNNGMWNTLETLTKNWEKPINRNSVDSWREMQKLYPKHSMLIQNWSIGHAQYIWNIRQNPNIIDIFAKIWNCNRDDLLVSFDAVSYHLPPESTNLGWYRGRNSYHTDQSYLDSDFKCIQGWVTGYDVDEGDATLSFLESSNKYHKDFKDEFEITVKDDWRKLNEKEIEFYVEGKDCLAKRIKCPKGSLVLWDSRTIHCGSEAIRSRKKPNFRNVVYVCYEPRSHCKEKMLEKKRKAFEEMRMTSHWPCKIKLFPKNPRTYGGPIYQVEELPKPVLTDLGKKLAGF